MSAFCVVHKLAGGKTCRVSSDVWGTRWGLIFLSCSASPNFEYAAKASVMWICCLYCLNGSPSFQISKTTEVGGNMISYSIGYPTRLTLSLSLSRFLFPLENKQIQTQTENQNLKEYRKLCLHGASWPALFPFRV